MKNNFSPSINIIRDADREFHYIPTANSRNIYRQIASNFRTGLHSFSIIGSYGTGKSAFLWAFQKHLLGKEIYFEPLNGQFSGCHQFEFINIVGEKKSLQKLLALHLDTLPSANSIFSSLVKKLEKLKTANKGLILFVDEFGKVLEYAAANDPGGELYFIQQLAEFVNDSQKDILLVTTLHQNFNAYAMGLQETQRKEWEKVKGRLKELTFNEPVEQLLQLASEFISKQDFGKAPSIDKELLDAINSTGAFSLMNKVEEGFAKRLFPFDLLSGMVLTIALRRYGQNERSLFNFLQTEEYYGLKNFKPDVQNPFYNLACVYNYLQFNYYSTLYSQNNPDYFKWIMLRNSLERIEIEFSQNIPEAQKIVKAIGLLDILGSEAAKISPQLLDLYAKHCLGIQNAHRILEGLEKKQIIRYQAFRSRFKLFEGTDVNIEEELRKAKAGGLQLGNIAVELDTFFQQRPYGRPNGHFISAKQITYLKGTPRFFQFKISERPIATFDHVQGEIDGFINLVFEEDAAREIQQVKGEPILYGLFTNADSIRDHLLEIKAIESAMTNIGEDKVAKQELLYLKEHQITILNDALHHQFFGETSPVKWFYDSAEINLPNGRAFNQMLSKIADDIYPDIPVFHNELMNKTNFSGSVSYSKKLFLHAMIEHWDKPDWGFPETAFPPEKTIYYTLMKNTGIHYSAKVFEYNFQPPSENSSFRSLWQASEQFLESAKISKRRVSEFMELLSQKPFKLKNGFIQFWVPTFLFIMREDVALFKDGRYVPRITAESLDLFGKQADKFEIKTFNVEGIRLDLFNKYRQLTQQNPKESATQTTFQETVRPFFLFYSNLPVYTQNTKSLSFDAIAFREVIKNAKELEKTFFEDLPTAFGTSLQQLAKSKEELENFVDRINASIAELRSAYDLMVDRGEAKLCQTIGKPKATFNQDIAYFEKRYVQLFGND